MVELIRTEAMKVEKSLTPSLAAMVVLLVILRRIWRWILCEGGCGGRRGKEGMEEG